MIDSEDKLNGESENEYVNNLNADKTQDEEMQAEESQTNGIQSKDSQDGRKNAKGGKRKVVMQKVKTFFKKLLGEFDSALFPLDCTCDVCGEELVEDTRYRLCSNVSRSCLSSKGIFV